MERKNYKFKNASIGVPEWKLIFVVIDLVELRTKLVQNGDFELANELREVIKDIDNLRPKGNE